jgi:DNA-binding Lrp family transcriptional regulator
MIDEIDAKIIQILKHDGRKTFVDIGKEIGLSEGAIRNRMQSMLESGVIEKFTIQVSPSTNLRGLIMISVDPSKPTSDISNQIHEMKAVERIYEVTGEHDIVAVISSLDIVGVNQCVERIRAIEGVVKTNTMIVLRTI